MTWPMTLSTTERREDCWTVHAWSFRVGDDAHAGGIATIAQKLLAFALKAALHPRQGQHRLVAVVAHAKCDVIDAVALQRAHNLFTQN